jgi:exopolysaccharide production protein ExoZ
LQLKSIQILRAAAALGVLLDHAGRWLDVAPIVDIGAAGVDLFFVISGFIMVYTSERLFGQTGAPQRFLARRIIRIVPLYWTLTAFAALVLFGFGPNTLGSYLFIPTHRGPILTVGWTLNYEMMFYSLFAT